MNENALSLISRLSAIAVLFWPNHSIINIVFVEKDHSSNRMLARSYSKNKTMVQRLYKLFKSSPGSSKQKYFHIKSCNRLPKTLFGAALFLRKRPKEMKVEAFE